MLLLVCFVVVRLYSLFLLLVRICYECFSTVVVLTSLSNCSMTRLWYWVPLWIGMSAFFRGVEKGAVYLFLELCVFSRLLYFVFSVL